MYRKLLCATYCTLQCSQVYEFIVWVKPVRWNRILTVKKCNLQGVVIHQPPARCTPLAQARNSWRTFCKWQAERITPSPSKFPAHLYLAPLNSAELSLVLCIWFRRGNALSFKIPCALQKIVSMWNTIWKALSIFRYNGVNVSFAKSVHEIRTGI